MPIYAYRCEHCGFQQDVLRKISDPPLVTCPSCGAAAFRKQVTAAGFQLKGSGWYVTDFRNPATKEAAKKTNDGDAPAGSKTQGGATEKAGGDASPTAPAAAPAAAPSASDAKAAPAAGGGTSS